MFKVSIIFAPFLLHLRVVWRYFVATPILQDLVGNIYALLIVALCILALMLLLYLGWRALVKANEIDRVVMDIENQLQSADSGVRAAA